MLQHCHDSTTLDPDMQDINFNPCFPLMIITFKVDHLEKVVEMVDKLRAGAAGDPGGQSGVPHIELLQCLGF